MVEELKVVKPVNSRLQLAQALVGQTKANGGVTLSHSFTSPEDGFMVSFAGGLETKEPTVNNVLSWMAEDGRYEAVAYGGAYLGGWKDDETGVFHFDLSLNLGYEAAKLFGAKEKQIAIWDVVNKCEIRLNEPKDPCPECGSGMKPLTGGGVKCVKCDYFECF